MTGKTHDQIALASALGAGLALSLPIDQAAVIAMGAYAVARAPDYTERGPFGWWSLPHRGPTHYMPTGAAVAAWFFVVLAALPGLALAYALAWSGGILIGWWAHSLADALTDMGCWLWRRRRQALLPKWARIHVYSITTKQRRTWLLGPKRTVTIKRPSMGEQCYRLVATCAVVVLAFAQIVMVAHTSLNGHA